MHTSLRTSSDILKILLVDDEDVVLHATREYLKTCFSFDVDIAVSGSSALARLSENEYDAIIADYEMESMSGLDLLKAIRERGDDTPFIIFTGKGREEVVIEAFERGADGYVQKGGEIRSQFAELAQKVRTAVCSTRSARAVHEQDTRHRILFETMGQGVIYQNRDGTIIEANRKLQLLSSITRHDILNSLGGLLLFLDGIPRSELSSVVRENLHRIEAYALTIQKQIKFTHDYQVLGLQKAIWQDLSRCFQKASDQFDTGRITVEEHLSGIEIFADPMLEKVIYNLIDNALRYGGPNLSKIFGYYRMDGEDLIWIIEDDGAGVAPEMKDQIMERGVGCNTGFGLFLSAEILSITGMTITETGTDGEGARFEIRVPKGMFRLGTDQRPEERG